MLWKALGFHKFLNHLQVQYNSNIIFVLWIVDDSGIYSSCMILDDDESYAISTWRQQGSGGESKVAWHLQADKLKAHFKQTETQNITQPFSLSYGPRLVVKVDLDLSNKIHAAKWCRFRVSWIGTIVFTLRSSSAIPRNNACQPRGFAWIESISGRLSGTEHSPKFNKMLKQSQQKQQRPHPTTELLSVFLYQLPVLLLLSF